jgi:hypothetical protein
MKYPVVLLNRSETDNIEIAVAPWEVPVLQVVHGSDRVIDTGRTEDVDREVPTAQAEYDRLDAKYKRDAGTGQRYVVAVYGVDATQLEEAIATAVQSWAPPAPAAKANKPEKPAAAVL